MATMYDLMLQVVAYAIIVFGSFLIYNFLSKGFLLTYIRVKASRGKNILVRVYTCIGKYYAIGVVKKDVLTYKQRNSKDIGTIDLEAAEILDEMGVKVVEIHETTGKVISKNWDAVNGQNIDKFDQLLVRALQGPRLQDKTKEMLMLILNVLQLIGIVFVGFLAFTISQTLQQGGATAATGGVI
jgi:hypothetical protein